MDLPVWFLAAIGMAVSAAFAGVAALLLWRSVSVGRRSLDLLSLLLLFLGIQSLQVLISGWLGLLTRNFMTVTSLVGLVACLASPASRRRIAACRREMIAPVMQTLRRGIVSSPALALGAAVCAVYILLHAAMFIVLAPPLTFDALTYHLSKVAQWIHTGSLYLPDLPIKRVFWPSGMELLNAWWAVFPHHEILIEAPGLFFHALAIGAVWTIARNIGLGRRAAGLAAILFSVTPAIVVHGTTCLTDLPTAALLLYLLALWTFPAPNEETARRRLFVTFSAGCFAVGIKPTIAFMAPGIAITAIPVLRKQDALALRSLFKASRTLWVLALAAAMLGSFWYIRNALRFGNPLYPVEIGQVTDDGLQSGAFSLTSLRMGLSMLLVEGGLFDGRLVIANLYRMTGWGWTAVSCGLPAALLFAVQSHRFRYLLIGQIVAVCTILGMVEPSFSCLRFLIWIPAILCIGFAGALRQSDLPRPIVCLLLVIAFWTTLLNLGSGLTNATGIDWLKQLKAPGKRPGPKAVTQARFARFVPPHEDIAVFMNREGNLYLAYGPGFTRGVFTIEASDTPVDFAKALDEAGLRFLYYHDLAGFYPRALESLQRQIDEGLMTDLRAGLYVRGSEVPSQEDWK